MYDKKLKELIEVIQKYEDANKEFRVNDIRMAEFSKAVNIANQLFEDMLVTIKPDALGLGHMVLCIEGFDIVICGKKEIDLFIQLISKASNFEIYAGDECVKFSIMFNKTFNVDIKI